MWVCECLCVCVYVVGPRRKWTQGMVKRLTHKSYTNKSVSRILCISLCVRVCVCVMPQLFDPQCSDKAYVPAIYIAYKQTCPHIYTQTRRHTERMCYEHVHVSSSKHSVGLCQKQFKLKTENH